MTGLGKNEMKPKAGMPWSVRFSEGLGRTWHKWLNGCDESLTQALVVETLWFA